MRTVLGSLYELLDTEKGLQLTPLELAEMTWLAKHWVKSNPNSTKGMREHESSDVIKNESDNKVEAQGQETRSHHEENVIEQEIQQEKDMKTSLSDTKHSNLGDSDAQTATEHLKTSAVQSIPLEKPIHLSRALHRIAQRAQVGAFEIDLKRTIRASADAGGAIVLHQQRRLISATTLIIIEDRSSHLVAFRDSYQQLKKMAEELGSFARLYHLSVNLNADEIVFTYNQQQVDLSKLVFNGRNLRVLLLTDGLAKRFRDGQFTAILSTLPQDTHIAWLHPWGSLWHRTSGMLKLGMCKPLAPSGSSTQDIAVPIIPMNLEGLSQLEIWSRGLGSKIGRKLPQVSKVDVKKAYKKPPQPQGKAEWMRYLTQKASALSSEAMKLLACIAAVPGEGIDLSLLMALGQRFVQVNSLTIRRVISEVITSGVLHRLQRESEERIVMGFNDLDARTAALFWIDHEGIQSVLEYLVHRAESNLIEHDLGIRLDLLLQVQGKEIPHTQSTSLEWNDSFEATLRVLRAARVPFTVLDELSKQEYTQANGENQKKIDTDERDTLDPDFEDLSSHEEKVGREKSVDELQVMQKWVKALKGYRNHEDSLPEGFLNDERISAYDAAQALFTKKVAAKGLRSRKLKRSKQRQMFGFKIANDILDNKLGIDQSFVALLAVPLLWPLDSAGDSDLAHWNISLGDDQVHARLGVYVLYAHRLPKRKYTTNRYRDPKYKQALEEFLNELNEIGIGKAQLFNLGNRSHVGMIQHVSSYEDLLKDPIKVLNDSIDSLARAD